VKPYLRAGSIKSWSDAQISPVSQWFTEITTALTNTKVAVLLVSPDFIAFDFIHEDELGPMLKEAEQGGSKFSSVSSSDPETKKRVLSLTPRTVIYAEDADHPGQSRPTFRSFDSTDQSVRAERHPEPAHQALAGTSSQGATHRYGQG
jgi:hypothetical protein